MLPFIARNVIYRAHERFLRRSTFRYLAELEESQWLSPDDVRRVQEAKLAALLRHARDCAPYYRKRFNEAGISVAVNDALRVLPDLPLLDKQDIRSSLESLLWRDAPGGLFAYHTGGSSGQPLMFYVDRRRQGYDQAARMRSHRWFGVDVGQRELYLWGSPIEHERTDNLKRLRDRLTNHRLLNAFNMSPRNMDHYLDEIDRFRPACLFGYPSSLSLLAEHGRARGRAVNTKNLRALFVTGEVCYPHHRETLRSYFGVPIADGYGSREAGFIAHECPLGNLHITAENVIVEIIEGGAPAPAGETGEIVVTHLDAYAMPFIRYRTGDVGRLKPGRCACGRGLPMMDVVQGRTTDFLYLPDGGIKHALSIIYPLREVSGMKQFRVTQHADYSVRVDVVPDGARGTVSAAAIARKVEPVLGEQIDVRVEVVDAIIAAESGKHRYVVSHARPAGERTLQEVNSGG